MKGRARQVLTADKRVIALLASLIILLAVGGVKLSNVVAANMLRADAQSTLTDWATTLQRKTDILAVIAGATPSEDTKNLLEDASQVGDIYRYVLWNRAGRIIFVSGRKNPSVEQANVSDVRQQRIADVIASSKTYSEVYAGNPPASPAYFADSYIPIIQNGSVAGVFEVYIDQTADKALYEKSFLLTESIIAIGVLLAVGIPGVMVYRVMMTRRVAQAEALFLAEHDTLTRIPNRKRLEEAATRALALTSRNKTHAAALYIDLDRFKAINDSLGHAVGDEVMRALAIRLESAIRGEDMAARIGGDEFVILQVGITQPAGASSLADRLMRILAEPYDIGGSHITCQASIGVAIAPTDADDWDSLLACAIAAVYKAKAEGRNTVRFFEAGMDSVFRERRQLEADLRRALDTKAFELAYQPLYSFQNGSLLGFEALLRWPTGWKPKSPAVFVPVAEESGLIVPIGAWVLETACRTAADWQEPLKVAVNLSPVQFRHGDVVAAVQKALTLSGLDPARLELEVTESLWIQDTDVVLEQLMRLREMGISIALDDFGTGYSSLTYLWKFPFDKVKIDRSFVMEMESDPKAAAIVRTIVALGRTLNLTITAEGVETQAQARDLREAGYDQAQGYLFGRPLSFEQANELVNENQTSSANPWGSHPLPETGSRPLISA